jgi:hypothetical protein
MVTLSMQSQEQSAGAGTIVCVYCKLEKAPSREHVLPTSLGGDLVRPILCTDCNGRRLSPLDQALAERSFVAMSRVASTPQDSFDVKLGGDHFTKDPGSGLVLEVAIGNDFQAEVIPQAHFPTSEGGKVQHVAFVTKDFPDFERFDSFVGRKLGTMKLRSMHLKIGPEDAGPTPRLVMHRSDDGFIRVPREQDTEQVFRTIEAGWSRAAADHRRAQASTTASAATAVMNPSVKISVSVNFNTVLRAVAKIAFNTTAAQLGTDFVLRSEFDDIRRYVLGDDVRIPETVAPDTLAVDNRFVRMLPVGTKPVIPTKEHAVTIFYSSPALLAWVTLYETNHFVARMANIELDEGVLAVQEFSKVRRGNRALEIGEIFRRIVAGAAS